MKSAFIVMATALCVVLVSSHPLPSEEEHLRSETLDRLMMIEADNEAALRSKRTIGILRELFPELSQMVEQKVNAIVAEVIRAVGPLVLRNFLGNNRQDSGSAGGSSPSDGSTVTAASPFDDDDEESGENGFASTSSNGSKVSIALPTFPPDEDEDADSTTIAPKETTTDANWNADTTTIATNTVA